MATATQTKDAIALLKADHKKVKELFDQFESTDKADEKREIAEEAITELKIHAVIEEEIFYPAVRKNLDQEDIMDEAEEEHRVAKTLIEDLDKNCAKDEHFEAKFTVLAENIRHHIKEEEKEMFKAAKDADLDLEQLGDHMAARKQELMDANELKSAIEESALRPYQELA